MDWAPHVTVAAIIEQDNRFLMVEEHDASGQLVINQPAGHLEAGESLLHAVTRETLEETGWPFTPQYLVGIYRWQMSPSGTTYIRFCFSGESDQSQPQQAIDQEIERAFWVSRETLENGDHVLRSPMVMRCINDYLAGQRLPLSVLHDIR